MYKRQEIDKAMTGHSARERIKAQIEERGVQNLYKITLKGLRDPDILFDLGDMDPYGNVVEVSDETKPAYEFGRLLEQNKDNLLGKFIAVSYTHLQSEERTAETYVEQLKVRTPSIDTVIGTLSGGNQQKVVIGKWTATCPRVFIMDTPTVGIDIGSKAEIYEPVSYTHLDVYKRQVLYRSRPKEDILILAQCEVQNQSKHPAG